MKAVFRDYALEFVCAFGFVQRKSADADWLNSCAEEQKIEIELIKDGQRIETVAKTEGVKFSRKNYIEKLDTDICDAEGLFKHLQSLIRFCDSYDPAEVEKAFSTEEYPWGQLFSFNWSSLGYAPGGVEYFLLPEEEKVMFTTGFLKLGWSDVRFHARDV